MSVHLNSLFILIFSSKIETKKRNVNLLHGRKHKIFNHKYKTNKQTKTYKLKIKKILAT